MLALASLLAGLCAQAPDSVQSKTVIVSDTLAARSVTAPDSAATAGMASPRPDSTAKALPPVAANVANPDSGKASGPPTGSGPVPGTGPVGPETDAGPIGPSGPASLAGPSPTGPVTSAGPLVVPGPTFGPAGRSTSPSDSAVLRRSTAGAMGLSLLLPGMGHRWIGRSSRAPLFHALDLLGFTALVVSWQMGDRSLESATEIANRHAGSSLGDDPDPDLLSAMRNYRSRRPQAGRHDSYDEAMLLSGKSTTWQFPDDDAHDWDWGSRETPENDVNLRSFESQLRTWRASRVALYSAAGTLVVLRLAAALDVLRLNRSSAARAGIALETKPIPGGVESKMAVNF